jgi:hypothetical protein
MSVFGGAQVLRRDVRRDVCRLGLKTYQNIAFYETCWSRVG